MRPYFRHPANDCRSDASRFVKFEFVSLQQDDEGVTALLRNVVDGATFDVRCAYLAGCDGGSSMVRDAIGLSLSGQARIMPRFMTHFRSNDRQLLRRWGIAWHYQSARGTLIAQNDSTPGRCTVDFRRAKQRKQLIRAR